MKKSIRAIDGVVFLDKPTGMTSRLAVFRVRRAFKAEKAGHTGSLDPLATGMLPICFGEATKFSDYLLGARKTYYVEAQLGICTDTGDAQGTILQQNNVDENALTQLDSQIEKFKGEIQQIPPMYSAVKFQGQALYKFARKGETIERQARRVTIYSIKRLPLTNATQFALEVYCSKGTYIRTLVEDIGNALGCGAHVTALRRLQVDNYSKEDMLSLDVLEQLAKYGKWLELEKLLLPITLLVDHLPKAVVNEEQSKRLCYGMSVKYDHPLPLGRVQLITDTGEFLGIGEMQENHYIGPKRMRREK